MNDKRTSWQGTPNRWGMTMWSPQQCPSGNPLWTYCTYPIGNTNETDPDHAHNAKMSQKGSRICGNPDIRHCAAGPRCDQHAPWALAGRPNPCTWTHPATSTASGAETP